MKITSVEYELHHITLEEPYQIAYETISHCENVSLRVITDQGLTGCGIAAPDQEITHENAQDVVRQIHEVIEPLLRGESPFRIDYFVHELKRAKVKSAARAMVDMALYDLLAKKAGLPLFQLLGGYRDQIQTSITIGIKPLAQTLEVAQKYLLSGFHIIKLKGGLSWEEDVEKVKKLRERFGDKISLRFDANQGYSIDDALSFIRHTQDARVEIFEQPSHFKNMTALQTITKRSPIPVMGDESIRNLSDAIHFVKHDAFDMISIKLQKVGGILESTHINSIAKSNQLEVMVSCLDECSLGIAAGLHFALSKPNLEFADLDGHLDMRDDPYRGLFELKNGVMTPNGKPGLGL